MIIKNAGLNGKLKNIVIENGIITDITENNVSGEALDAKGYYVIPGLIDVHTHGIMGYDTMDADFCNMCKYFAENGTTSFLPTTMTMGYDDLKKVTNAKIDFDGANILGFHFEGPYISPKYKGAQNEKYIKKPNIEEFNEFRNVKMITVAPEIEGAFEFIKEVSKSAVVSLGHTDCDYETAIKAIENGANCLTHTFNAMPPLHHRNAGPIGAGVDMENVLYHQPDDLSDGLTTEKDWKIYGGHRFWTSPESDDSYYPDNEPIEYILEEESVLFTQKTDLWTGFKKQLRLSFCDNGDLKVEHILTNCNANAVKVALWGITTLKGGGVAKIPCKGNAGGYAPNRAISLWFDTSISDSRLSFENDCIVGRHLPCNNKLKIGAYTPQGKIYMENLGQKLEITFAAHKMENCPDHGCNAELFLDTNIMELETLGELKEIAPNETVKHTEYWHICQLNA